MKIVIFEADEWEVRACSDLQPRHELTCTSDPLNETNASAYSDAEAISAFVESQLSAAVLSKFPRLKLIATRSTGYDHIDLQYCAKAGIAVANVPSYGDVTVAEHVFALLLGLARNLVLTVERMRSGRFDQSDLSGIDLYGKTMGVVGTGRIGRRVIRIARGFGMPVLAFDLKPDRESAALEDVRYTDLASLLRQSDVVSLHVPATTTTQGMIGEDEFALMKQGAILINTARGNVIDVEALVRAVTSGQIRAAGLDVLPQEPLMRDEAEVFRGTAVGAASVKALLANHVLMALPNVLVTPHVAYNTVEARRRIIDGTIENIQAFADGTPINLVGSEFGRESPSGNRGAAA